MQGSQRGEIVKRLSDSLFAAIGHAETQVLLDRKLVKNPAILRYVDESKPGEPSTKTTPTRGKKAPSALRHFSIEQRPKKLWS